MLLPRAVCKMVHLAVAARTFLATSGARLTRFLVSAQRGSQFVTPVRPKTPRQHGSILDR